MDVFDISLILSNENPGKYSPTTHKTLAILKINEGLLILCTLPW